jgi:hypothetical protein
LGFDIDNGGAMVFILSLFYVYHLYLILTTIQTIPPANLPAFFKTSLEPAMLVSILELFREMVRIDTGAERKSVIGEYLDHFTHVPRLETVVLFLSRKEKDVARDVWESLGVSKGDLGRQWGTVW